MESKGLNKTLNMKIDVEMTVSEDTADICRKILEVYLKQNPDVQLTCNNRSELIFRKPYL